MATIGQLIGDNLVAVSQLFFKFNTYFTSVVQQPYGYNVTGQLQEPKDLIRPATAKAVLLPYFNRPRLRYYKRSSSFNPHTRFLEHSAE